MTIDTYLSEIYAADIRGNKIAALTDLQVALAANPALMIEAQVKQKELNDLIEARGVQACAYSTKYNEYLNEVLAP